MSKIRPNLRLCWRLRTPANHSNLLDAFEGLADKSVLVTPALQIADSVIY
jgi:hypothetical protein